MAEVKKEEKKQEAPPKAEAPAKKPDKKQDKKHGKKEYSKKEKEKPKEDKIAARVRVSGVILDGSLDLARALTGIKGIGLRVSKSLTKAIGLEKGVKLSSLSEKEIEDIENAVSCLNKNLPGWMLNRRKDLTTGENMHVVGPELDITKRADIDRLKKMRSYRGIRHSLNLPVRGQRTRSSFRKGGTVGVMRKKAQPAATADAKKK